MSSHSRTAGRVGQLGEFQRVGFAVQRSSKRGPSSSVHANLHMWSHLQLCLGCHTLAGRVPYHACPDVPASLASGIQYMEPATDADAGADADAAGTQWVADADVDRGQLGRLPADDPVGLSAIRDTSAIQQAAEGEVLFLKGNAFPGAEGRAIVHRSPDAVDEARPRLLLTLNPPPPPGCGCADPGCASRS